MSPEHLKKFPQAFQACPGWSTKVIDRRRLGTHIGRYKGSLVIGPIIAALATAIVNNLVSLASQKSRLLTAAIKRRRSQRETLRRPAENAQNCHPKRS